jgi:hypothetical protein
MRAPSSLSRSLALLLLVGAVLLVAGAVAHPMLPTDPTAQLGVIERTPHWRAIHLIMMAGSGLVIAGMWTRLGAAVSEAPPALLAALVIIAAGLALNASNIEFMARVGTADASRYADGDAGVVRVFAVGHLAAVDRARLGNLLVAFGCLALGWTEWRDAARSRWFAMLAWVAGIGGLVGVAIFESGSPGQLTAVALFLAWSIATAVVAISPAGRSEAGVAS